MCCVSEQVAIVIKYFFQFGFFPWNKYVDYTKDKPYHPPNIIGIEKKEGYVHYDLVQLLALFFHRSILKVSWVHVIFYFVFNFLVIRVILSYIELYKFIVSLVNTAINACNKHCDINILK